MVFVKFVILFIIFWICIYIGFCKSSEFIFRVENLEKLKRAFVMFKSKIEFTYEPLKEICDDISKIIYLDSPNMFKSFIGELEAGNYENAWVLAVAENSNYLDKSDIKLINTFGDLLGKTDIKGQINELELALNFLDTQIKSAQDIRIKNEKLYKSLGTIVGVTIIIIFI